MKKTMTIICLLAMTVSVLAKQYPDSVRQASAEEPNIAYGWNFEFAGGVAAGSYTYRQLFAPEPAGDRHVTNKVHFPSWNAAFGLSYYFVPWMGIGTGVQFSSYVNNAAVDKPWVTPVRKDAFGDDYTLTATPQNLSEYQEIYMLEIPLALKFRYRPGVVGLTATAGAKIGLPMNARYNTSANASIRNAVHYPLYDLTIRDVPTVVESRDIPVRQGNYGLTMFNQLNYAAYAELGMLIRLHQRVELAIAAYANYYFTDVLATHSTTGLGFSDGQSIGEYPAAYTETYNGVLRTNEVQTLHPWSAGLKIGIQINANRTKAQRDYDREQRRLRKLAKDSVPTEDTIPAIVEPVPADTVAEEETVEEIIEAEITDPRERAILQIMQIAEENGINICEEICVPIPVFVHDTIYVNCEEADPAVKAAAAKKLAAVVYFHLDKSVPILQPKNVLTAIAKELRHYPDQKVEISGYACRLGKPAYNRRLALRRAKAVAAKLRSMGVREDQMIITSHGATDSYKNTQKHPLSKDRRVEIYWAE